MASSNMYMTHNDILAFWFEEIESKQWFNNDPLFDIEIRNRFSDVHTAASRCELFPWRATPEGQLAEVIVLDQFSRNMFRDSPLAFASDPLALALAQSAVAAGYDKALTQQQRNFLYMPYMHSESLRIHDEAVKLFTANGNESTLEFELGHRKIIERFGRYPHRNTRLGRESTPEEVAYLAQPGAGY